MHSSEEVGFSVISVESLVGSGSAWKLVVRVVAMATVEGVQLHVRPNFRRDPLLCCHGDVGCYGYFLTYLKN